MKMEPIDEWGFKTYRFKDNPMEKRFVDMWITLNEQSQYHLHRLLGFDATDEQINAANTIIQWLGTPVGISFLRDVLEIEYPCEKCLVQACCQGRDLTCPERRSWGDSRLAKGIKE